MPASGGDLGQTRGAAATHMKKSLPAQARPLALLLRNCCSKYLAGLAIDESKAQRVGALAESAQDPCALAGVVGVGPVSR